MVSHLRENIGGLGRKYCVFKRTKHSAGDAGFAFILIALMFLVANIAYGSEKLVQIELNKIENTNGKCSAYFVLENKGPYEFLDLKVEVVIFNTNNIVSGYLSIQLAPLRRNKTSVKIFKLGNLPCDKIGKLLLNDVISCDGEGNRNDCLDLLSTTSRSAIPLIS